MVPHFTRVAAALLTIMSTHQLMAIEPHYAAGYEAIRQKQWERAAKEFEESYQQMPQALTAYLAAYSYSRFGDVVGTRGWGVAALRGKPPLEKRYRVAVAQLLGWADATERRVTIRMVCTMEPRACEYLTTHPLKRALPDHVNVARDSDVDAMYGKAINETDSHLTDRNSTEAGRLAALREEADFQKTEKTWLSELPAPAVEIPKQ